MSAMKIFVALLLTVLTGFTGLVYEVSWQKYLSTLLGSHSEATAAVLAIFLGGLSLGYAVFGKATRTLQARARGRGRPARLLVFYAALEGAIGLYALVFPRLFGGVQRLSLQLPEFGPATDFLIDVLLAVVLIGPPSILMGGTIPILTLVLSRSLATATRVHAWVYGFNTIGAFAGALIGGFFLIPLMGLDRVSYTMGAINLLAAAIFLVLDRSGLRPPEDSPHVESADSSSVVSGYSGLMLVAALSGFAMMTIQTILNRVGALAFGPSMFTFAMVVAVFVLSIAVGSLAVSFLKNIPSRMIVASQWALVICLVLLYGLVENAPYYAHVIRSVFQPTPAAFYSFQFASLLWLLMVLLVPVGLSGALLPLLFHHLRQTVGELGTTAGRLYSWNTAGSLLGALFGGYLLLFFFDLHVVFRVALAALVLCAAILTVQLLKISPLAVAALVMVPALIGLWSLPEWDPERLDSGLFRKREATALTYAGADAFFENRKRRIVFHRDGPSTTATVRDGRKDEDRPDFSLSTNGKPDGNLIGDYPTMALAALFPALLAEENRRSFVIGYGTGVTAGELAALDSMQEVHVAEISQAVLDAAPYFEAGNQAPLASPKLSLHRSDAYRSLLRAQGQYDIIVSEPSNPWVSGVEMLFSRGFLEAAKNKLSPGGVYAQWFHLYETDDEAVALVLRTYLSVFDHVSLWFTMQSDLVIMGIQDPERALDVGAIRKRFEQPDFSAAFGRVSIQNLAAVFAHEIVPLGVLNALEMDGPIQTLRHPRLSHLAAQAFFRGGRGELPELVRPESVRVGLQNSLLRKLFMTGEFPPVVLGIAASENCRFDRGAACATFMAKWKHDNSAPESFAALLPRLQKNPSVSSQLRMESIEGLAGFFGGERFRSPGARPLAFAQAQTNRYLRHFNLVMPFDRAVLEDIWRACDSPPCQPAMAKLESVVGPLDIYSPRSRPVKARRKKPGVGHNQKWP
jgi:spermidine synthase